MKHLFQVHSPISGLVARRIILQNSLHDAEVLLMCTGGYKPSFEEYATVEYPYTFFPDYFQVSFAFWRNWGRMRRLYAWLNNITGGQEFLYYVNQSSMNTFHLIANHPRCLGFYYLEEGSASYSEAVHIKAVKAPSRLRDILYSLNFKGRSPSVKPFYQPAHPKYLGCFATNEFAFSSFPKRQIIGMPFERSGKLLPYDNIIVIECSVEYGHIRSAEHQVALVRRMLEVMLVNGVVRAHYKFHHAQKLETSRRALQQLFDEYRPRFELLEELNAPYTLEQIAAESEATFWLGYSSAGIYASLLGRKVYSILHWIMESEPAFARLQQTIPRVMFERFEFLD